MSTFNALTVESNVAVNANVNITTDVGALAIDADAENATTGLLTVAAGVTLTSAAGITLDATTQGITFTGAGTLNAVNGVTINDAVTATAGTLTIDADTDNDGTGTFTTIAAGTINSTGQTLDITAGDVSLAGAVSAATLINITDSDGNGIGLGDTALGAFQLSGTELQLLTATTLELATAGNVTVDNITAANSNNVTNLTIDAAGAITFATAKSTFNALNVEADGAVIANVDIETDVGALLIDADDDNNAGTGTGLLTVAAGVTLTSAAGITLDATTGGISFTAAGTSEPPLTASPLTMRSRPLLVPLRLMLIPIMMVPVRLRPLPPAQLIRLVRPLISPLEMSLSAVQLPRRRLSTSQILMAAALASAIRL